MGAESEFDLSQLLCLRDQYEYGSSFKTGKGAACVVSVSEDRSEAKILCKHIMHSKIRVAGKVKACEVEEDGGRRRSDVVAPKSERRKPAASARMAGTLASEGWTLAPDNDSQHGLITYSR